MKKEHQKKKEYFNLYTIKFKFKNKCNLLYAVGYVATFSFSFL